MSLAARGYGHLELGGETRPFQIGLFQARAFCEAQGVELGQYRETLNTLNLSASATLEDELIFRAWIYSALKAGAALEKQPFDFTLDDVSFWVDQAPVSVLKPFFDVLQSIQDTAPGNDQGQPATKTKQK